MIVNKYSNVFKVIVQSPNQKIHYRKCNLVKGLGQTGWLTILPQHENFMTLLKRSSIHIKQFSNIHVIHLVRNSIMQYMHEQNICKITTPYFFIKMLT